MDTGHVWEKIKKTVVDGVTIAAEKTEEYTRLGKAKLDVLAVRRKMTKRQTDLGAQIYQAVKDGKTDGVFDSETVKGMVDELQGLETELGQKEMVFQELRNHAQADVEEVKKKAMSGMEEIKTKTKARMNRKKKKVEAGTEAQQGTPKPAKDIPVE